MAAVADDSRPDAGRPRSRGLRPELGQRARAAGVQQPAGDDRRVRDRHRGARATSRRRGSCSNASFEKMMPQSQPYIKNYLTYQKDLRGLGNAMRVVVENTDGDIFDPALPRGAEADQRRALPDPGRRPRVGEVAVDARRALDRGDRGRLPRRPGDAGRLRRLGAERRAAEAEHRALGHRRQPGGQQLQVEHDLRAAARQGAGDRQAHRLPRAVEGARREDPRQVRARARASTRRVRPRRRRRSRSTSSASPSWSAT